MRAGLADPVRDSQRIFRAVLAAMAQPGHITDVPGPFDTPSALDPATCGVCLALVDFETPLWLDRRAATKDVVDYLRFHCSCPLVDQPGAARFAVIADLDGRPDLEAFDLGTDVSPERSATLVIQVQALAARTGRALSGPGIRTRTLLHVEGVDERFWREVRDNGALFPRGVDIILSAGTVIAALPRTVRVEA